MRGVTIDPTRRIARVEGGALWMDATEPAADHRLAALHGSSPDVGIAGYSLGGGIGWYARKLGLASNSLTAVELVTAGGEHVRADATQNVELFWALRGGGGNFGVVTALEFRLYPIETAYAGMLVWDRDHAERVLRRWADWAPEAPDAVTTSFRFLNLPPMPRSPSRCAAGRSSSSTGRCSAATPRRARSSPCCAARPGDRHLRPRARPVPDPLHMDPEGAAPAVSDGTLLGELGDVTIDTILEQVGPGRPPPCSRPSCDSSVVHSAGPRGPRRPRDDRRGIRSLRRRDRGRPPEMAMQGQLDAHQFTRSLEPWATGRSYLNFAENEVDARTGYSESAWLQLKGIRSAYDPDDRFLANHRIPRLFEDGQVTA